MKAAGIAGKARSRTAIPIDMLPCDTAMPTSSIIITRPGRRLESGRRARTILVSLLSVWLSGPLGAAAPAGAPVELSEAQVHAAQIRARTTVCGEEAPAVAAHMEQAYSEWLERNPAIAQEALHSLYFGPEAQASMAAYEALRQRFEKELRRDLESNPKSFAEDCNAFFSDLTAGALDYP